jgi:2'-5' RNA ligase
MKKLEEQELERLNNATKSLREARNTIADIEISAHRLESRKKAVLFNAEQAAEELNNIQGELQEKYGNVLIDVTTGEIKEDNHDNS